MRQALGVLLGRALLAAGLQSNGEFVARSATDGAKLWHFNTGAGVNAPPVSYAVDGTQFVAVASGGHRLFDFPLGDAVIAFGLSD